MPNARSGSGVRERHAAAHAARRLALETLFEADFGQHTPDAVLQRKLAVAALPAEAGQLAASIVGAVVAQREAIDRSIEAFAPVYPVVQLARIDRALLRSALGELLHCPTTPTRVAISEWVRLARTYSGEPARRLLNGVLGRIATELAGTERGARTSDHNQDRPRRAAQGEEGAG